MAQKIAKEPKETDIKVCVDTSDLDVALEKANRLVELLGRASERIDSLSKKRLNDLSQKVSSGEMTVNQARREMGLPPNNDDSSNCYLMSEKFYKSLRKDANNPPAEIIIALKMDGTLNAEGIRKVIDKVNEQLEGLENSPQVKYIFK